MRITAATAAAVLALLLARAETAAQTTTPPAPPAPPAAPAAAPAQAPADSAAPRTRTRYRNNVLTKEEIAAANIHSNAYDVVSRLRAGWMRNRGGNIAADPDGSVEVRVWFNGQSLGSVETLRQINVDQIDEMRWIDPIQARSVYGPGNGRGVIAIKGR
jgi:hypothetical protein